MLMKRQLKVSEFIINGKQDTITIITRGRYQKI